MPNQHPFLSECVPHAGYPEFGNEMNKTGRPIVYSCSWPAYWDEAAGLPDYPSIQKHCNLWRNYGDIQVNINGVQCSLQK